MARFMVELILSDAEEEAITKLNDSFPNVHPTDDLNAVYRGQLALLFKFFLQNNPVHYIEVS